MACAATSPAPKSTTSDESSQAQYRVFSSFATEYDLDAGAAAMLLVGDLDTMFSVIDAFEKYFPLVLWVRLLHLAWYQGPAEVTAMLERREKYLKLAHMIEPKKRRALLEVTLATAAALTTEDAYVDLYMELISLSDPGLLPLNAPALFAMKANRADIMRFVLAMATPDEPELLDREMVQDLMESAIGEVKAELQAYYALHYGS